MKIYCPIIIYKQGTATCFTFVYYKFNDNAINKIADEREIGISLKNCTAKLLRCTIRMPPRVCTVGKLYRLGKILEMHNWNAMQINKTEHEDTCKAVRNPSILKREKIEIAFEPHCYCTLNVICQFKLSTCTAHTLLVGSNNNPHEQMK